MLNPDQLARFHHDGYLVVEGVLEPGDLAAIEAEYAAILDRVLPELAARRLIADPGPGSFGERYVAALRQLGDVYELYQHLGAQVVPLEVGAGGMVLLHKLTKHGSLANETDGIRWSFGEWARMWWAARDRIARGEVSAAINGRWDANAGQPVCA